MESKNRTQSNDKTRHIQELMSKLVKASEIQRPTVPKAKPIKPIPQSSSYDDWKDDIYLTLPFHD